MKKLIVVGIFLFLFGLHGCFTINPPDEKIRIVTTLFPQYDFVRAIVGDFDHVSTQLLIKAGQDVHSYDPSFQDMLDIKKADLFIYTGSELETWAKTVVDSLPSKVKVLDLSAVEGIQLIPIDDDHHDEEEHVEHGAYDSHIWTNPAYALLMGEAIRDSLIALDPENRTTYETNAQNYLSEVEAIDQEIRQFAKQAKEMGRDTLYFAAPFAFIYFIREYDLKYYSIYDTCSTEVDPSAEAVIEMIKEIKDHNIPIIYTKELISDEIANKIIEKTGVQKRVLHSAHNVSIQDFNAGITYINIMKNNIDVLEEGLTN